MDTTDVCEIFIAMNEQGDWIVGTDAESATESMATDFGGAVCRMVAIRVHMNRPRIEQLADVVVPSEAVRDHATAVPAGE